MPSFARSLAAMKLAMEAVRVGIGDGVARVAPTWNVDRRVALNAIRMHPPPRDERLILGAEAAGFGTSTGSLKLESLVPVWPSTNFQVVEGRKAPRLNKIKCFFSYVGIQIGW